MSTRNSQGPVLPRRLAHALSAIAETLPNLWDESDDYFVPFAAEFAADQPMSADALRGPLEVGTRYHLDLDTVDLTAAGADYGDDVAAEGFRTLDLAMKATLSEITRVTARAPGVVRVRVWLVGRFSSGWLVGLRTESTET